MCKDVFTPLLISTNNLSEHYDVLKVEQIYIQNFMKKIILLILLVFSFSCKQSVEDELQICGINDPANNSKWFKQLIDFQKRHNLNPALVRQFTFENKTFYALYNGAVSLKYDFLDNPQIYSCDGVEVSDSWGQGTYDFFFRQSIKQGIVWTKGKTEEKLRITPCGTTQPEKDLAWLIKVIRFLDRNAWKGVVYEYEYNGKLVFFGIYTFTPNSRQSNLAIIDCEGVNLTEEDNWSQTDFRMKAVNLGVIYQK
jgi:hypothetical protein